MATIEELIAERQRRDAAAAQGATGRPSLKEEADRRRELARQKRGLTMADIVAERDRRAAKPNLAEEAARRRSAADRRFEESMMVPPAPGNAIVPAAKPQGYDERNIRSAPEGDLVAELTRGLRLGVQDVGGGIANLLGLPGDVAELADRAVLSIYNAAVPERYEAQARPSPLGSASIKNSAATLAEALGYDVIRPEEKTSEERILSQARQMATEGLVAGTGLARAAAAGTPAPHAFTAPYRTAASPARVVAGDTAAGAGSGLAMGTYDERVPDAVKDRLGAFGPILSGIVGGVGGATLATSLEAPRALVDAFTDRLPASTSKIPVDPDTGLPVSRGAVKQAARALQDATLDRDAAVRNIDRNLSEIGAGAAPTLGPLSDDPGLIAAERRLRSGPAGPEYVARDRAVRNSASERVRDTRPVDADPERARNAARAAIDQAIAGVDAPVARLKEDVATQGQALDDIAAYLSTGRSMNEASRDLDRILVSDTYLPARAEKNRLYDDAAADPDVVVGTESARAAAQAQRSAIEEANPVLQDKRARDIASAFSVPDEGLLPGSGLPMVPEGQDARVVRPLGSVMSDRRALGYVEQEARAKGEFGRADTARSIRKGINDDIRAAADSGVPGTEKLATADRYYRERFAPFFRNGNVSPRFFADIDRDPSRSATVPEATGGRFLLTGHNGRAAAEDVNRILSIAPDRKEGIAAATEYVIADAVEKGVIQKGRVNENRLAAFIAKREGMFGALPEMKGAFDNLLKDVRAGNAKANDLAAQLADAERTADLTRKEIDRGALKLIMDADPDKAAASVFGRPDAAAAMRDVVKAFRGNRDAMRGWKAAVSDHLVDRVTAAGRGGVSDGNDPVSLAALSRFFQKNEKALSEIFTPDEMQALQQARRRLEVLSNAGIGQAGSPQLGEGLGGVRGILRALASPIGTVTLLRKGALMAGSVERRINAVADYFPDSSGAAQTLIGRAMFDPAVAKHLLEFPVSDAQVATWSKKLNRLLVYGQAGEDEGE